MAENKVEERVYHFNAKIENCEIRKVEQVDGSFTSPEGKEIDYHYILLTVDEGEDFNRIFLKDKNMENLQKYKRGMIGTFTIRVDVSEGYGGRTKFLVTDFMEN